jgi:hypothetical protein
MEYAANDWYPEDEWDQRLEAGEEGSDEVRKLVKQHAAALKLSKTTGQYIIIR